MAAFAEALVEVLLPARCATCRRPLPWRASEAGVCAPCWATLPHHRGPRCPRCAGDTAAAGLPCLVCRDSPPPWAGTISVGPYEGLLRDLVVLLKYGRRDELATPLARRLAAAVDGAGWPSPDVVTAVPLARVRRWRRGFNQAELLARPLAGALGAPFRSLLRRRQRAAQVGRSRSQRLRIAPGTFRARGALSGTVLLVDDVVTTGATARACTTALRRAGAAAVYLAAIAHTPPPGRTP